MLPRIKRFFQAHPLLRDALVWAVPALAIGALLRLLLLSYLPLGYWGTDSRSYYGLAHKLFTEGVYNNDEKREYLYPILMVPVTLLPGVPLRWLAWLQHGLGLLSVLPLAYVVRKTMHWWRAWIIPVTVAYAMHPMFLWYEHELLGEVLFFAGFAWAFGGWVAWVSEKDAGRARRLFWWWFVPMAVFLLTKPAGRFVLPGIAVGLLMVRAWRVLDWVRWASIAALAALTMTVGSGKQGAWLLYTATFPLTQLDTPLHADYKASIRERVQEQAARIDTHYLDSRAAMDFLESPGEHGGDALWVALDKDTVKQRRVYMDLAKEGIFAEPMTYLYLSLQRLAASANISAFEAFEMSRFSSRYYPTRFQKLYEEASRQIEAGKKGKDRPSLAMAFGFNRTESLPPYAEFRPRLAPNPDCWAERTVLSTVKAYANACDFVELPPQKKGTPIEQQAFYHTRVTPLGWWLLLSLLLSLVWWRTVGVWTVIAVGYLCGVYLCALVQTRFFLPAWLVFFPVACVPLDLLARLCARRKVAADDEKR